jgi:hypothetical protein
MEKLNRWHFAAFVLGGGFIALLLTLALFSL